MEEKDSKDISPLEKKETPKQIDEDIAKTTDVDLDTDEKEDSDAADKDKSTPQTGEEGAKSLEADDDTRQLLQRMVMKERKRKRSSLPYRLEIGLRSTRQRRTQYCRN